MKKSREVPSSRLSRLSKLGSLAGSVAGQMLLEGAVQLATGKRPKLNDLLMQPKHLLQLADRLAHMRGAAMKLGQLISMDVGQVLPEELASILAILRDGANPMPQRQVEQMLMANWAEDWRTRVSQFDMAPFAAASIGQVHRATAHDGTALAVKIQYPGVGKSIHSDVDNLGALLKMTRLVPPQLNLPGLLLDVKMQLIREADYDLEADNLRRYQVLVKDRFDMQIPELIEDLCSEQVLTMTYIDGVSLEQTLSLPQAQRNELADTLVKLLVAELFEFRVIQSDPNLANYLYCPAQHQLALLDFGAVRRIPDDISNAYRTLLRDVLNGELDAAVETIVRLGFFREPLPDDTAQLVKRLLEIAAEPFLVDAPFDFAKGDIARRIQGLSNAFFEHRETFDNPPIDAMFIHRKVAGLYLLLGKLRAQVNLHAMVTPLLAENPGNTE